MTVWDNKEKIRKEISTLQSELDRILYLLQIADPTGEAAKKRESTGQKPKTFVKNLPTSDTGNRPPPEKNPQKIDPSSDKSLKLVPKGPLVKSVKEEAIAEAKPESDVKKEEPESVNDKSTATVYTVAKPQWLGAVGDREKQETRQEVPVDVQEKDQFVDYKDRETILSKTDASLGDPGIENAAPGLIIRKRKQVEKSNTSEVKDSEQSIGPDLKAEDAVALLLRHSRGYPALDEEDRPTSEDVIVENQGNKDGKKPKRVLGPERPSFLAEPDYSAWVPPEGN